MESGAKSWVRFKYESLPNLGFWCGRLDHSDKNCELWLQSKGSLTPDQQQFNSNLKAAPYTSTGRDVIVVPGFYENKSPFTRKAYQTARMRAEATVVKTVASRPDMAQANMEIEVSECIIANEVLVTKEGGVGDTL